MKCELYCAATEFESVKKHSFMTQGDLSHENLDMETFFIY